MSKQVLVRAIPERVRSWIDAERLQLQMSQQEFLVTVLERACDQNGEQLTLLEPAYTPPEEEKNLSFNFVDLFAGIGGFRIPLNDIGGKCVFTSEMDRYCQKTYKNWFGDVPHGDITRIPVSEIPNHDVLAAGFPCQPFSIAGVSKKNSLGRPHGFKCEIQGTLFFNIASIIEIKRPPIVLLENVKNLRSHDCGRTWRLINETLESLGYEVFSKVIDSAHFVPQHRERIYLICFDKDVFGEGVKFEFPDLPKKGSVQIAEILEPNPNPKYTLSDHLWKYLQEYAERHRAKGNGFGFGLTDLTGISRTLSARYYKDGSEILIPQTGKNPRRLTPVECRRLMGFPEYLPIVVSDTQAYRQFGNAVVPKVAEFVISAVAPFISIYNKKYNRKNSRVMSTRL